MGIGKYFTSLEQKELFYSIIDHQYLDTFFSVPSHLCALWTLTQAPVYKTRGLGRQEAPHQPADMSHVAGSL